MELLGFSLANKIIENMVVATFVLDANGRVIIWNKACERLTGVSSSEVVGTHDHWRAFYDQPRDCLADLIASRHLGDLGRLYALHGEPGNEDAGLRAENWCVMPRVGKRHYLAIDAGLICDDKGQMLAVVETIRDMTEKQLAEEALYNLAMEDGLTGAANRRSFDLALTAEWKRAAREHSSLSLALIDVDLFKAYNDGYGHQTGDECLKMVAGAIAAQANRSTDTVARYGGEEFAVILPSTDHQGALEVGERIRASVQLLAIPHAGSQDHGCVTVSVGIATTVPSLDESSDTLLSRADNALYTAKRSGRNRVQIGK